MSLCSSYQVGGHCEQMFQCIYQHVDLKNTILQDLSEATNGKQWPFSTYSPVQGKPSIPSYIEDLSFEEMRLECYQTKTINLVKSAIEKMDEKVKQARQLCFPSKPVLSLYPPLSNDENFGVIARRSPFCCIPENPQSFEEIHWEWCKLMQQFTESNKWRLSAANAKMSELLKFHQGVEKRLYAMYCDQGFRRRNNASKLDMLGILQNRFSHIRSRSNSNFINQIASIPPTPLELVGNVFQQALIVHSSSSETLSTETSKSDNSESGVDLTSTGEETSQKKKTDTIKVIVLPEENTNEQMMTEEELRQLEENLIEELTKSSHTNISFKSIENQKNGLFIECIGRQTVQWLKLTLKYFNSTKKTQLPLVTCVPNAHVIQLHLPCSSGYDLEKILNLFKVQNEKLNLQTWKIVESSTVAKKDKSLIVFVDDESFKSMQEQGLMLFYKFGMINILELDKTDYALKIKKEKSLNEAMLVEDILAQCPSLLSGNKEDKQDLNNQSDAVTEEETNKLEEKQSSVEDTSSSKEKDSIETVEQLENQKDDSKENKEKEKDTNSDDIENPKSDDDASTLQVETLADSGIAADASVNASQSIENEEKEF